MKIIKSGRIPVAEKTWREICRYCGAELEISRKDLKEEECAGFSPYYTYKCPCCKKRNTTLKY